MRIKSTLTRSPAAKWFSLRVLHRGSSRRTIAELKKSGHPGVALVGQAVQSTWGRAPFPERRWISGIERERKRLLSDGSPLVDGTLGDGGLYDSGKTVSGSCSVSKYPRAARFLLMLARAIDPTEVLELGTNVGISSAYLAAGLEINGRGSRITTLDGSAYRQRLAKELHRNLGLDQTVDYVEGLFTDTLGPTLSRLGPVDLAFIDGHHQYQPTLAYFEMIFEHATEDAIFVFDDIRWSDGMRKAWDEIRRDERLGVIVDLHSMGICFRSREGEARRHFGPAPLF